MIASEAGKRLVEGHVGHEASLPEGGDPARLLAYLYAHSARPEFVVRYHWHSGDLGFWDNRSTWHSVAGDYGDQDRIIQRVTLKGVEPV